MIKDGVEYLAHSRPDGVPFIGYYNKDWCYIDNDCYKVIGEISPDALGYVKEGDEFDEEQIEVTEPWKYSSSKKWENDYRLAKDRITGKEQKVRPYSPSFGISRWEILEIYFSDRVIKIKGPYGHFH